MSPCDGHTTDVATMGARDVVAAFRRAFPGRVRACYVEGSWADATMLETSDLDLVLIFAGESTAAEQEQACLLGATCAQASRLELDVTVVDEAALAEGASPQLMLGARLVCGEPRSACPSAIPIAPRSSSAMCDGPPVWQGARANLARGTWSNRLAG
ncbi:MAG: nucleotidyltransferase domain-containing protein [Chloroflexi bacterium]|nr:nucleotidyltransferase domain-containing protein [Chloroflexota bacterium]